MIENKKSLITLSALTIFLYVGSNNGQEIPPLIDPSQSLEPLANENTVHRLIAAIEDLPIVDMDSDELTFLNQSWYGEEDNQIESFEPVKISYFQQKLRACGIMLLLKYIELKEFAADMYEKVKRIHNQILFKLK